MTYEQYWEGNPYIVKQFEEAHKLRNQQKNEEMFIMGHYVFQAIMTAISNVHFDNQPHKTNEYLEKPFDLTPKTKEQKENEVEKARQNIIAGLTAWKESWDKSQEKQKEVVN